MSGVNKAILVGRVGQDPDVRYMTSGDAVANVSLATSEQWKDKNGEKQERTEWHRLVFFRKLAEIVEKYVKKGSLLYIEGKLQTRSYEKEGVKHYTTEIVVDSMQMLGGRKDGEQSAPAGGEPPSSKPAPSKNFDNFDDDIPF